MSTSGRWTVGTLLGLAAWIGAMVLVAVVNDDASDPMPVVVTFIVGAGLFFGAVFGIALWQTRRKPVPELDALLASLTLEGQEPPTSARAFLGGRRTARVYLVLGIVVTALGLATVLLGVLESPLTGVAVGATVITVVGWAAAVPAVLRNRRADATALLAPLGLAERDGVVTGTRHGRRVSVTFSARGSRTTVRPERGHPIVVTRIGHPDGGWLRDLADAEERAAAASN